jgi:PAS domain S-box-containing protein
MVLPLSSEGRTLGVLAIFASAAENLDAEDAAILKELANDLAYGITTLRIRAERRQMEQALSVREQGYRTLVEHIPDLIVRYDLNLRRIFVNPAWEKAAGLSAAEVIDIPADEVRRVPSLDTPSYTDKLRAALESGTVQNIEFNWINAWGATLHLEYAITPEFDQNGNVVSLLAIGHDITERKRMEAGLRIAASAFEAQEGIVVTDANQVILRVNRAFSTITGYAPADAVGRTPKLLKSGRHDAGYYQAMWECIHQYGAWQGEIWNRRRSGEIYPEWLSITAVRSDAGEVTNYVGTLIDISARKAAEKEIEYLAFYDPLT